MPKKYKLGLQKEMESAVKGAGKASKGHRGSAAKSPKKPPKLHTLKEM